MKLSINTVGKKGTLEANTLRIYLPVPLRESANLEHGDTFEYKVDNNKIAFKFSPAGDIILNQSGFLCIRASAFEPPLRIRSTEQVMASVKGDWIAFQIPTSFELKEKGFGLIEDTL